MSISSALTNAFSGLAVGARLAGISSENISNALTEGFARRQAVVGNRLAGVASLGVRVIGIERQVREGLVQDLRLAEAGLGAEGRRLEALKKLEAALGTVGSPASMSERIVSFEKSLIEAASRPESEARLTAVAEAAHQLALAFNDASDAVQTARQSADKAIGRDVEALNEGLRGIKALNTAIARADARGEETSTLLDQRQKLVDNISQIVPLREVARPNGQIALFTTAGMTLVDGRIARVEFDPTPIVTPEMTMVGGALSGLKIDGLTIPTSPHGGRLGAGSLSAHFAIRDELTPGMQLQLDGLARNLIERVSDVTVDPTLAPGAPGIFTDAGSAFDPAYEAGLAGRISLNSAIGPGSSGEVWRLRDGLGATAPTGLADATILQALASSVRESRALTSPGLSGSGSLSSLASEIAAMASTTRLAAESSMSFASARREGLAAELLADGVDTDRELQDLLLIEQAYAANARVIQTIDEMMRNILEI